MMDWLWEKVQSLLMWLLGFLLVALGIWAYPSIKEQLTDVQNQTSDEPTAPAIPLEQAARLIKAAEPNARDPRGWALDLLEALRLHGLPQSLENVCAVIAITDQESGFVANPAVPNLGKLSEQAVLQKLNKIPMLGDGAALFLNQFPDKGNSFMQRIRKAKTERDLDLAYRDLITGLGQYARQYKLGLLLDNGFARDLIEGNNEIDTIGSMQVAVSFAVQYETEQRNGKALSLEEVYGVRDKLYTRKGGLYYGTLLLLGYKTGYDKKIYRFADFNAGRYSSRNAAFQAAVSALQGKALATDGDLLIYQEDGAVAASTSGTEKATLAVAGQLGLPLKASDIRKDFAQEKTLAFNDTRTYKAIMAAYRTQARQAAPYAIIPGITLRSEKASRILTTEKFATTVNGRYQRCVSGTAN